MVKWSVGVLALVGSVVAVVGVYQVNVGNKKDALAIVFAGLICLIIAWFLCPLANKKENA